MNCAFSAGKSAANESSNLACLGRGTVFGGRIGGTGAPGNRVLDDAFPLALSGANAAIRRASRPWDPFLPRDHDPAIRWPTQMTGPRLRRVTRLVTATSSAKRDRRVLGQWRPRPLLFQDPVHPFPAGSVSESAGHKYDRTCAAATANMVILPYGSTRDDSCLTAPILARRSAAQERAGPSTGPVGRSAFRIGRRTETLRRRCLYLSCGLITTSLTVGVVRLRLADLVVRVFRFLNHC